MSRILSAFVVGLLFALGLGVAGMTQPEKIVGFLDISGAWDPRLVLVLAAAVGLYSLGFRLVMRRQRPLFEPAFSVPTRSDITPSLIGGATLFGLGWGLAGYCPAPALVASAGGSGKAAVVVLAMLGGMLLHKAYEAARQKRPANGLVLALSPANELKR